MDKLLVTSNSLNSQIAVMIMLAAFLAIVLFMFIMAYRIRRKKRESGELDVENSDRKTIAGYLPLGFIITIPLGILIDNIPLGIALGPAFGLLIGLVVRGFKGNKDFQEKRELTQDELKLKKIGQFLLFLLILLGIGLFFFTYGFNF